jgi:hypothetical protein
MRAYRSSTPEWIQLGQARRRGQRPSAAVWITDHENQRYNLVASGAYALGLPLPEQTVFIAGLDVILLAHRSERTAEVALSIASAAPNLFSIYWRGEGAERVLM